MADFSGKSTCSALRCFFSLSSPEGGEGRGEEAASTCEVRTPPSPTLPPLVPRRERETFVERAKHRPEKSGGWLNPEEAVGPSPPTGRHGTPTTCEYMGIPP